MIRRAALLLAGSLLLPAAAHAISDPSEALADPHAEARAVAIGQHLRCLVCQNESIEDSGADLARDLRRIVRQRVSAGDSDAQITDWLVARYGNFVRLNPPLEFSTLLLWGSPVLALLAGVFVIWLTRRPGAPTPAPLSEAERTRLSSLLDT